MHKQASWIQSFFGEGLEAGVDYDFFYLPGIDDAYGKPFLVAGDLVATEAERRHRSGHRLAGLQRVEAEEPTAGGAGGGATAVSHIVTAGW